jgi:tetratricopeptide (TPR) repeat protein
MKKQIFKLKTISVLIVLIFLTNVSAQHASSAANDAARLMGEIQQSLKARNHDEVIEKATRLLVLMPKSSDVYVVRGTGYMLKGETEKAVADFNKGFELGINPKMEVSTRKLRAIAQFKLKRYDEAIEDFSFLIQKESGDFRAYLQRGWSFFYKGNHRAAVADFDSTLKLSPQEKGVRRYRAVSHYELGNYEKAVEDINEEIRINPAPLAEVYKTRANAYRKLGKTELAEADEKKFAEMAEMNVKRSDQPSQLNVAPKPQAKLEELIEKAQGHFGRHEWDAAIQGYNEIISLLGDDSEGLYAVYFSRGRCFYEKGNLERALVDYNEVIKRRPDLSGGFTFRGEVYLKKNELDLALSDFTRAIKLDSTDILAYRRRAEAYNLKQDYDNAVKDCGDVIRLDPKYQSAWYLRADSYFKKGDFKAALKDITEYIKLKNTDAEAYSFRAKIYRKLNDEKAAEADEKRAVMLTDSTEINE